MYIFRDRKSDSFLNFDVRRFALWFGRCIAAGEQRCYKGDRGECRRALAKGGDIHEFQEQE